MKLIVLCITDNRAGNSSSYSSLEEAQAACEGIDLVNDDRSIGIVYDLSLPGIVWPLADDIADDEWMAILRRVAAMAMADKVNALTTPEPG
jgi:hypothetical protein